MFKDKPDKDSLAAGVAGYLADSSIHLSHGRRIGIEQLQQRGVNVTDLRGVPDLRDAVWNLYHAINWTLQDTGAFKIIESCHNTAFIRSVIVQQIPFPGAPSPILPVPLQRPNITNKKRKRK